MIDTETDKKATGFRIKLKAKSRDVNGVSPFENHEQYHLTRISYVHNVLDSGITIVTTYSGSERVYTYMTEYSLEGIEMIKYIGAQIDSEYKEELENQKLDRLLF